MPRAKSFSKLELTDAAGVQLMLNGVEEGLHLSQGDTREAVGAIEWRLLTAGLLHKELALVARHERTAEGCQSIQLTPGHEAGVGRLHGPVERVSLAQVLAHLEARVT